MIPDQNMTRNETKCGHDNPIATYPLMISFSIAYATVGILGFLGNIAILITVLAKREIQCITNGIICHLAFSDIFLCLTSLWMTPSVILSTDHSWRFGESLCYLKQVFSALSFHVCAYTLTLIAVDRYLLIVHAFKTYHRKGCCVWSICIMWLVASCMSIPYVAKTVYSHPMPQRCPDIYFCLDSRWTQGDRIVYGISIFVFKSVIPFTVIAFCYSRIKTKLMELDKQMKGRKYSCRDRIPGEHSDVDRKRALNRILIAMVIVFGISTVPLDLINLIWDVNWHKAIIPLPARAIINLVSHFLAITATLWNPLLYAWWNTSFKKEMKNRIEIIKTKTSTIIPFYRPQTAQQTSVQLSSKSSQKSPAGQGLDQWDTDYDADFNKYRIDEILKHRRSTGLTLLPCPTPGNSAHSGSPKWSANLSVTATPNLARRKSNIPLPDMDSSLRQALLAPRPVNKESEIAGIDFDSSSSPVAHLTIATSASVAPPTFQGKIHHPERNGDGWPLMPKIDIHGLSSMEQTAKPAPLAESEATEISYQGGLNSDSARSNHSGCAKSVDTSPTALCQSDIVDLYTAEVFL